MRNNSHTLGISLAGTLAVAALVTASLASGPDTQQLPSAQPAPDRSAVERSTSVLTVDESPAGQRGGSAASRSQDRGLALPNEPAALRVFDEPVVAAAAPEAVDADFGELGFTGVTPEPVAAPEPAPEPAAQDEAPAQIPQSAVQSEALPESDPDPEPEPAPPAAGGVLGIAASYVGHPYVLGGTTPAGFDCSGYTSYVFRQVGISLPRTAAAQQSYATPVSNPQPGDLVFWGYPAYHVGIYAGNGMVYDAGNPGTGVIYRSVFSGVSGYGRVG